LLSKKKVGNPLNQDCGSTTGGSGSEYNRFRNPSLNPP